MEVDARPLDQSVDAEIDRDMGTPDSGVEDQGTSSDSALMTDLNPQNFEFNKNANKVAQQNGGE